MVTGMLIGTVTVRYDWHSEGLFLFPISELAGISHFSHKWEKERSLVIILFSVF